MKTIDAVIERGKDGLYCIYLPDISGYMDREKRRIMQN